MANGGQAFDITNEKSELNQYWYSEATIAALVSEVEHNAESCAFLSCPSLYFALTSAPLRAKSKVFEYDRQWSSDPGFVFYDYHAPLEVPIHLMAAFDYVVVDPPFITREVWTQYLDTVKLLLKPNGKVLFTSVLENHGMLEQGLDQGLYVPLFKPSIPHLTYQYHCFLNYVATKLQFDNPELPPEDSKIRSALRMANDLRESEKAFTAQMLSRDRDGEAPLPSLQRTGNTAGHGGSDRVMQWTHIPEGLTMYANGADAPPAEPAEPQDFGPEYKACDARRALIDTFKRGVDQSQKLLDIVFKNSGKESRKATEAAEAAQRERIALLESMAAIVKRIADDELKSSADAALLPVMQDCIEAYTNVPIEHAKLQELAADATRLYKSPLFNRQKELLAEMKASKKAHVVSSQQAPPAVSTA